MSGSLLPAGSNLTCRYSPVDAAGALRAPDEWVGASRAGLPAAYGSLLCESPSMLSGRADLAGVSPNAQQFGAPANYTFYSPPVVSTTTPSSGPSAGGTVVVVRGSSLTPAAEGSRCDIVCRFGERLVPGSADDAVRRNHLRLPANAAAAGHALSFYVSLNRQDFSAARRTFRYVEGGTASSRSASPLSSPPLAPARAVLSNRRRIAPQRR